MNAATLRVQHIYLTLLTCTTLAASFIWGVNTLFLLEAGLSNTEAFAANAFYTAGMLLFEVPTGVVADLKGRRLSYLIGVITLMVSTLLYLWMWHIAAPFWAWALSSACLGFGYTFFSGATEAWLVDALNSTGYKGKLEKVFAKGAIAEGAAMLTGSVAGGVVAQFTNLGVPYLLRAGLLGLTFIVAFIYMRDLGFTPARGKNPVKEVKVILNNSIKHGLRNPPVRWMMLSGVFTMGTLLYVFYALQPYLLELYGNPDAYSIAGLAAAIVAGAQVAGGLLSARVIGMFKKRTSVLMIATFTSVIVLALTGLWANFIAVIILMIIWALLFALVMPVRKAYINELIPTNQRATVLSFDSLFSSAGGVVSQPLLGKSADVWSYPVSYVLGAAIQAVTLPFVWLARKEYSVADTISPDEVPKV